jgi:peptidoglycan hydrolase-like protein with peptidoglycan-binding domain
MAKNKPVFSVLLCSGVLVLGACGMGSDSGRSSSRGSATSGQASGMSSSSQISQAQQALKAKGYDPGTTDGVMGSQTQQALRRFQQANGLPATGTLDAQTAKALGVSTSGSGSSGAGSSRGSSGSSSGSGESSGGSDRTRGGGGE